MIEWRSIPLLGGVYEASDRGDIRRRLPPGSGRIIKQSFNGTGYYKVSVCVEGVENTHPVHRLVASAFIGVCPSGYVVNHLDGCKTNNSRSNLEYTTHAGNMLHAAENGLMPSGDRHGRYTKPERTARGERVNTCRLTADQVVEARMLRTAGATLSQLCKKFGLSKSAMWSLVTGKNWKHIK